MSERPFHELNQIAQYAEHVRWIVDTYSLPEKVRDKLRLTAQVLDAEAENFEALEAKLSKMEENIRPIIEADYMGQGSAQDYDAVLEAIQEELEEALAGEKCNHPNVVSARNKAIQSGLYCPDCRTLISEITEEA